MASVTYAAQTGAAVALSAATVKTILGIKSGATFGIQVVQFKVAFDGVTASAVPVLCELCLRDVRDQRSRYGVDVGDSGAARRPRARSRCHGRARVELGADGADRH